MISPQTSAILSAMCATPIYGVNCLLAVFCGYALWRKGGLKGSNWALVTVIIVQWVLCTGNFVAIFLLLIKGFVHPPSIPGLSDNSSALPTGLVSGPGVTNSTAYFENQSSPEHMAQVSFYIVNSLVADCFMTWRVYVVYKRRNWIAAPLVVLNIITLVFAALMIRALAIVQYNVQKFHANPELQRVLTMWGTSVATQTAGTLLIVYRELSTPSYVPSAKASRCLTLTSIGCAIVDSGATYTVGIIFTLAFYTTGRAEGAILAAIVAQISATVPLSIIVREWWKTVVPISVRGPLLPRSALVRETHEMSHRENLHLQTNDSQGTSGVNISVVKSTHMDIHSIVANDDGTKNAQLGNYLDI